MTISRSYLIFPSMQYSAETHLGIIAACIPIIRPFFSSSRRPHFQGWRKIFAKTAFPAKQTLADEGKGPLHRAPVRNWDSVSLALRSLDEGRSGADDASSWRTRNAGLIQKHPIKANTSSIKEDLEPFGNTTYGNQNGDNISRGGEVTEHV